MMMGTTTTTTTNGIVDYGFVFEEETQLNVLKTSLFFVGDGFSVYNCQSELVFRVDSYGPYLRDKDEVILMDANGKCIITVHKKRPSLHHRWEGFKGEKLEGDKPIFSLRTSSIIGIGRSSMTVEVYGNSTEEYQIDGSFSQRCCTFTNLSRESVVEIKRKVDATANVILGKDVFSLWVKPGFDAAFAMSLILILDQINCALDYGCDDHNIATS